MKYKVGDLVRVCWRKEGIDEIPAIIGTAGMVISRRMVPHWGSLQPEPVYEVYLTNLECREILEKALEKL